jgi:hypothetical protein
MTKIPFGVIKAVDELFRVRNEIKLLMKVDEELSKGIKIHMQENGLDVIEAKKSQAEFLTRENRSIDPEQYLEALDGDMDKLLSSVTVRIDIDKKNDRAGARSYLGEQQLNDISAVTRGPVLSVKKLETKPVSMSLGNGNTVVKVATA